MSKSKKEIKKELYEYFSYMQQEDNKSLLGGMAWDDIAWHIKYAEDNGILRTQLGFDFPKLLGHLIIEYEKYKNIGTVEECEKAMKFVKHYQEENKYL